jgi:hypothetical protein
MAATGARKQLLRMLRTRFLITNVGSGAQKCDVVVGVRGYDSAAGNQIAAISDPRRTIELSELESDGWAVS